VSGWRDRLAADRAATTERLGGLTRSFNDLVESTRSANTDDEHDPEGATIAFERQHVAAMISRARDRLAEIDAALARLDEGSYGACERCGLPIGDDRLAARPAATTCVRCAAKRR
jgi:RNA polymerase-binding protein DksA